MKIAPLLHIGRGVTALIGGGGKTTLMETLAEELSKKGTVIVTTTTHIRRPERYETLLDADEDAVRAALEKESIVCVASRTDGGKLCAPQLAMETLSCLADFVLVEADGSKRLPVKAHEPYEPVVPPEANQTIALFGLSGLGHPICEVAHRAELYAKNLGVSPDTILTPQLAAAHLNLEALHTRVLLNQADVPGGRALARAMAEELQTPVCMASLREEWAECLS